MGRPRSVTRSGSRAPTREIGTILGGVFSPAGMAPWNVFYVDDQEFVPELVWPKSVRTYSEMRTDSQVAALYTATTLGVRKFKWSVDPNGAEDAMVEKISRDYNLPILGEKQQTKRRYKRRFSFNEHLRKALYAGIYGHYFFEQVGYIGDSVNQPADGLWHLKKLAERPPHTIQNFRVSADGGLVSILQNVTNVEGPQTWLGMPEIPVDNLIGYVWEQEGANWTGRSWFRDIFKNWAIKDRLVRIDAVNHERAGGVPYIEAHPGATMAEVMELNAMAQSFRVGDTSGGAVPAGAHLQIAKGTNSSVVDSMRYHDEAMARKFMLMVMQLGQTERGSRSLGNTFVEFWADGLTTIGDWVVDTFCEFMIEDDIDWNWGEDVDNVPLLTYEIDPELVMADFVAAVMNGIIETDDDLEYYVRKELGLPDKGTPRMSIDQQLQKQQIEKPPPPAPAPGDPSGGGSGAGTPPSSTKASGETVGLPRPSPFALQEGDINVQAGIGRHSVAAGRLAAAWWGREVDGPEQAAGDEPLRRTGAAGAGESVDDG